MSQCQAPLLQKLPLHQKQTHKNDTSPTAPINTCTDKKQPPKNFKLTCTPTMSEDLLPTSPGAKAPPGTLSLPTLLNGNVGPAPGQMQVQPQLTHGIKTMHLRLPHPCSLDVLPSPTNKWSATTHPIKGKIFGFINSTVSYQHFISIKAVSFTLRHLPPAPPRRPSAMAANQRGAPSLMMPLDITVR
jgi:hypothetical protein